MNRTLRPAGLRRVVVGVLAFALMHTAAAATFVVTTTADSNDGACTVALCSLRDAVIASNATAGANTITLPAGTYTLTIPGTGEDNAATGDLDIRNSVTINGAGAATTIVDGGAIDRVFDVLAGAVVINGVTIRNGLPGPGDNGGGIQNISTLTLNNSIVTANHTSNGGAGAGIWVQGALTLNGTTVSGNAAGGGGNGGGIFSQGIFTISSSTISGNAAGPAGGNGAGIYNNGSASSITNSTISGNTGAGGGNGAGLYENGSGTTIAASTFSGNTTNGDGGGIFVNGQPLNLTNVTISGNTAVSGGGIFNNGNGLHIIASTIANNTGGGIANNGSADATGTIFANNGANCSGTITDGGTNLQFPGTTCSLSIPTADPLLQPLANNGGPTQTHALVAGSPAVDANTEICPPTPPTDQRGIARPQGPACDIGAFELVTVAGTADLSVVVTDAPDPVAAGANITYTITVSNGGPSTATTVTLSDSTPVNTTFVSASAPAGWSLTTPAVGTTGTVTATNASLASGANATITMVVKVGPAVAAGTIVTDIATITSAVSDPNATNNTSTTTTTVAAAATTADLSITKIGSPNPVAAGSNLTYTLTVTNNGPSAATSVSLSDATPANTTFVSAAAPAGWVLTTPAVGGTGTVTATNASLASGASATITLVVQVGPAVVAGTIITNTATIASAVSDPNPNNNASTATTTVTAVVVPPPAVIVPTLGDAALAALAVLLLAAAMFALRRRQR